MSRKGWKASKDWPRRCLIIGLALDRHNDQSTSATDPNSATFPTRSSRAPKTFQIFCLGKYWVLWQCNLALTVLLDSLLSNRTLIRHSFWRRIDSHGGWMMEIPLSHHSRGFERPGLLFLLRDAWRRRGQKCGQHTCCSWNFVGKLRALGYKRGWVDDFKLHVTLSIR